MDKEIPTEITLKQICKERKLDPRLSRLILREAVKDINKFPNLAKSHKNKMPWVWQKGSKGLDEALVALNIKN